MRSMPSTKRIPRCMSTQHPDNVAMPFFAQGAPLTAEDEVREAYYAFSHLGCDEQMWDFEGKEVDGHVRSEEHTSELQSLTNLVCRLLLEKKKNEARKE